MATGTMRTPDGAALLNNIGNAKSDQGDLPGGFRTLLHAWLARFHVTPRDDLGAVLQVLSGDRPVTVDHGWLYRRYAQIATVTPG